MKRIFIIITFAGLILSNSQFSFANDGGDGLIYIHSARVLPKGHLQLYTGTRFFGKIAQFGNSNRAFTLWNVQGKSSLNLGINPHLELFVSPIFYQDTNTESGNVLEGQGNAPDDIFIGMKIASFGALESPFLFGGRIYARLPAAASHNIIYEPYSAGKVEIGLTGLASYYSNVTFPDESWSLHANISYVNHNDVGVKLTKDPAELTAIAMSSDLKIGAGILLPAGTFDFSAEINATTFINRPPEAAYSREFVSYLTAGVYYKPYRWLTFKMGVDLKLFSGDNMTNTALSPSIADFPNYPDWRGVLGVKIGILPFSQFRSDKTDMRGEYNGQKQVLDQILQGQKSEENADKELKKLQSERKGIEDELNRLRKLLNKEKTTTKKKK